jgi:hypothetical protein
VDVVGIMESDDVSDLWQLQVALTQARSGRRLWTAFLPAVFLAIFSVSVDGVGADSLAMAGALVVIGATILYFVWLVSRVRERRDSADLADGWLVVVEHRLAQLAAQPGS